MSVFTLGGGCFWCLDSAYVQFRGVLEVTCGYAGGHKPNPTYEDVCHTNTGHAEVVQVEFDDTVISAEQILDIFFTLHDPTQLNRQGNDIGTQYRSAMYYTDATQRGQFEGAIERAKEIWGDGIVTEVTELEKFWPAEEYHQDFFAKNPNQGYCLAVVAPKVAKVRAKFTELTK
jgi:peptide-methionine (S)-S-oxide reductase